MGGCSLKTLHANLFTLFLHSFFKGWGVKVVIFIKKINW